ncbi:uncharacterized protein CCOS01_02763 [Colletotrichum costaricense]|uniref:Uncharacterized protein n=1 Tax=Colletotrichum costaricense TaxID=1209916 RepID=A0AAJ0E6Q8_9PEZI|nr:uncharacterized protein CCOS01_02763 [Colletotrichum costaricense]KAK1537443.1 hypothetical protein CCOS01_02763 [Colletotrichum costaricense]
MTTEAAPALGLEGQLHEEYIDYSEDDSAAPAVVVEGSNITSFPANAHPVTDEVEYTGTSALEPDNQTVGQQVDAEIDAISVAADASLQPGDPDPTNELQVDGVDSISAIEAEDSYMNEDESLAYADVAKPEDGLAAENEISWEDGPANKEDAAQNEENEHEDNEVEDGQDENSQDESHITLEKDEWQLVEEKDGLPRGGLSPANSAGDQETEAHEVDQELVDSSNDANNLDANLDVFDVADVDAGLDEQQVAEADNTEVNDLHEIDFNDGGNIATVDAIVGTSDTRSEHTPEYQKTDGDFPTKQDAEDHPMGVDTESQPEDELESIMGVADADQANDEENHDDVVNAEDYDAVAEDLSVPEHVEFDDEVLADVRSSVSAETPTHGEMEIPVITVSYKGIDYPFFYGSPDSQGKECFFNDLTLLHCKMEGVLAGFRRELANELGPFDELVFQIDELGLEFTEVRSHPPETQALLTYPKSSQAEVFSDITLGQIISVFDSLVKNQNADASKPLYAYLTTRPNCKKRWLSLVDDAYNGKGLDEISYYFASRAQSEVLEIMDDEPDLIGEEDNADAASWPQSPAVSGHGEHNLDEAEGENEEINEDDDVGDGITGEDDIQSQNALEENHLQQDESAISMPDAEATMLDTEASLMDETTAVADLSVVEDSGDVEDATEDQQPQENGEAGKDDLSQVTQCFFPNFCLCATCTSTFVADQMAEEDDFRFETLVRVAKESARQRGRSLSSNSHLALPKRLLSRRTSRHLHSCSDSSITFSSTADADARTQAPEIDESNPLASEMQDAAVLGTAIDAQNTFDDEEAAIIADEIVENANESFAEKVTPDTSATSTLNGDEEVTYENELDLNADLPEAEVVEAEVVDEDDGLAEIDWREFSGQGDDEIAVESPSASGKRQRSDVDDLLDAEAQQGTLKRLKRL